MSVMKFLGQFGIYSIREFGLKPEECLLIIFSLVTLRHALET